MFDEANHAKKILLICSKISNSDGIGRHALALSEQFRGSGCEVVFFTIIQGSFLDKCQHFFSKFYMRHIFDLVFMLVASCVRKVFYRSYLSVSPSVICAIGTNQIHFSSCHLHSLLVANERWKLYLSPRNIFYVLVEYYQYKRCKQAIFISRQQRDQFRDYYGIRRHPSYVIPPVLNSINFPKSHTNQNFGCNFFDKKIRRFLFIGYNFRLKGLEIAQSSISSVCGELDIVGDDRRYKPPDTTRGIHRFLGSMQFKDIVWSDYGFLIFPTHSDSYAFVIQEAVRNGLIPICSSQAGGSEVLSDLGFSNCVIKQEPKVVPEKISAIAMDYSNAIHRWWAMDTKSELFNLNSSKIYDEESYMEDVLQALFINTKRI